MKKILLAMSLLSSALTLSAQTFTCPANVVCTMNDQNVTTCSYSLGSNWIVSKPISVNLPKPNTLFYFNFKMASGYSSGIINGETCNYQDPTNGMNWVTLSSTSSITPQLNAPGSLWHTTAVSGYYSCDNAKYPDQCPFTNITKINS